MLSPDKVGPVGARIETQSLIHKEGNSGNGALERIEDAVGSQCYAVGWIGANVVSSVGIVFVNKLLFQQYDFRYGTTLTLIHFAFISTVLFIAKTLGYFNPKPRQPVREVLPLALTFAGFVVGTNLSLSLNSVGTFQILKIVNTPVAAIAQFFLQGTRLDKYSSLSLLVVCIGAGITSITDVEMRASGLIVGCLAVLSTVAYQMIARSRQKRWELSSLEMLYEVAPVAACILVLCLPILDGTLMSTQTGRVSIGEYHWTAPVLLLLGLSSTIAISVNVSMFMAIKLTSVVSYNVIGHCKTGLILLGGYLFFSSIPSLRNAAGVVVTLGGVISYSHLRISKELRERTEQQGGHDASVPLYKQVQRVIPLPIPKHDNDDDG